MSDFIIKVKGPERSLELQIPVSSGPSLSGLVDKMQNALSEEEEPEKTGLFKKKKTGEKKKGSKATTTAGVLLASVILAALSND